MKNNGYAETTIRGTSDRLELLSKNVNIDNPKEVKHFIANQPWSSFFKNAVSYAYDKYVKANGLEWKITIYKTSNDEFITAVAHNAEEARKLREVGFEKYDEFDGVHLYCKRK